MNFMGRFENDYIFYLILNTARFNHCNGSYDMTTLYHSGSFVFPIREMLIIDLQRCKLIRFYSFLACS